MQSSYVNTFFPASQLQPTPRTLASNRAFARENPRTPLKKTAPENARGRWTQEEKKAFEEALKRYGKDWKKVEAYVATRSGTQIRSHAQKYFLKEKERKRKRLHQASTQITEVNTPEKIEPTHINADVDKLLTELKDQDPLLSMKDALRIEQLEVQCNSALQLLTSTIQHSKNLVQSLPVVRANFAQVRRSALDALGELEGEFKRRCREVLDTAEFEVTEIDRCLLECRKSRELAAAEECPYLAERMAEFGIGGVEDVYKRYTKLGDWTDTRFRTIIRWTRWNSMADMMIMRNWAYRMGIM